MSIVAKRSNNIKDQKGTIDIHFQELKTREFRPTSRWGETKGKHKC